MSLSIAMLTAVLLQAPPSPSPSASPAASESPSPSPTSTTAPTPIDPKAPKVTVVLGEPSDKSWPVTGSAEYPDEKALQAAARRLERRWDLVAERFSEILSDTLRKYGTALVKSKTYKADMKPGPTGFYRLTLVCKEDDALLYEQRAALGRPDKLFTTSVDKVKRVVDIIEKSKGFFTEMVQVHKGEKPATPAARLDFTTRVAAPERELDDILVDSDLSAIVSILKEVYYHLRNAQIWSKGAGKGEGEYPDQGMFLNPDLTIGDMEKKIKNAAHILSCEVKLSIAGLMDEHYERAGSDPKKLARLRDIAKEAVKYLAEAPEKDEKFQKILEKAKEAREEKDIADIRAELKNMIDALLRKP